jgi:hypothetical protein
MPGVHGDGRPCRVNGRRRPPATDQPPDPPTFLIDRTLGRHVFPQRVVACGYGCLTLAEFYGDEHAAQAAADTTWLAEAAGRDLVILTRDGNPYVNEHERLALERYRHRVFWIGPKKGTGQDWATRSRPTTEPSSGTPGGLDRTSSRSSNEDSSGLGRDPGRSACDGARPGSCDQSVTNRGQRPGSGTPPAHVRGRFPWSQGVTRAEGGGFEPPRDVTPNTDSSRAP